MKREPLTVEVLDRLAGVDADAWNRLAGEHDPFVEHGFLHGLEATNCVGPPSTGWVPRHLVVYEGDGKSRRLVAAMPLYEKYDSYGEYIFDWGWARAAQMAAIPYYPKLVGAVPFTPATGNRLLLHPEHSSGEPASRLIAALLDAVEQLATTLEASSTHLLFITAAEDAALRDHGYLPRASYQFHWQRTEAWRTFGDYVAALRAPARKAIRRERKTAAAHGLTLSTRRGAELSDRDWLALHAFYESTIGRKWAQPYLTKEFFDYLRSHYAHRVVASFAHHGSEPVAGALLFSKGQHLYGRYWGCHRRLDAMHFELCYYQPIEWALANGITRFEAGAQGEHKLKRGFLPTMTRSAHWIRPPALAEAIERFLPRERAAVEYEIDALSAHSPFRRDC